MQHKDARFRIPSPGNGMRGQEMRVSCHVAIQDLGLRGL